MVFAVRSHPAHIQPHALHDAAKCLIRYQLMIIIYCCWKARGALQVFSQNKPALILASSHLQC